MTVSLRFADGTIHVAGSLPSTVRDALPALTDDPRTGGARVPGGQYAALRGALDDADVAVDDDVFDFPPPLPQHASTEQDPDPGSAVADPVASLASLSSPYDLRAYQRTALAAWQDAGARGNLELPTGSGKTVIALAAIEALGVPTLVVVPTIDLLEQWRRELEAVFDVDVGQFGGGEQRREPITVSTYDSALHRAESDGDAFGFVVFDEVHHLGGDRYRDIARSLPAPARLGLTATFERPDDAHEVVADLVGPLVHRLDVDDLAGDHLAPYDVDRIEVSLGPEERERYDRNQETFTDYLAQSGIQFRSGSDYQELVKRSGTDPAARRALLAKERARRIMLGSDAKVDALADVLADHRDDRVIVFTAHNDFAYQVAERFLLPVITHQTPTSERREILERFRSGRYSRVVSSNVLDEGVDVPAANVGVLCSGSSSEREFTQRLGRILRPREGKRAILYEIVSENTAEEGVARRRR